MQSRIETINGGDYNRVPRNLFSILVYNITERCYVIIVINY